MTFAQPFKDYQILAKAGAGAMGTVFKARHKKLDRIVALKVLRPSLARDERYVDRLRREARIVASLSHPHIVTGYDICEEGGYHFFVMEFVEGPSLRALLSEWGVFPEEQVLKAAMQAASALDHAFQRGIIHRDIKPGNILIDEQGNLKLTDMGLAKGPTDLTLTRDGATVGTPQYISPEQARNPQDVDVRSDLYSLGATLYHMATGQPPFRGSTMAEVITKVLHEHAPAAHDVNAAIGEGLSLVIRKLLAKDLELRYQTPAELLDDLRRVQRAEQPHVDRSQLEAAERGPRPSLLRRLSLGAGALVIVAAAVWFGTSLRRDGPVVERPADFLQRLDREMAGLPDQAERYAHLQKATANAPEGTFKALQERHQQLLAAVQQDLDRAMLQLQKQDWPALQKWLEDPATWPDSTDFERERLAQALQQATGFQRSQLPGGVRQQELDKLLGEVAEKVRRRDAALVAAVQQQGRGEQLARTNALLDAGEFRAAEQLWATGLLPFCDGVRAPRLERLRADTRQQVQQVWQQADEAAEARIDACERGVAAALQQQAAAGLQELRQRSEGGDAAALLGALDGLRRSLEACYPKPDQFRVQHNPWTAIDAEFGKLGDALQVRLQAETAARVEARIGMAWRTMVNGDPRDAAAVLATGLGDAQQQARMQPHRDAIAAAQAVADAVVRALPAAPRQFQALLRAAPLQPVELEVRQFEDGPGLWAVAEQRREALGEIVFGSLLAVAQAADARLFDGVEARRLARGRLVLAMVSDDLAGIGPQLQAAADDFLAGQVWPLIAAVRREQGTAIASAADGLRSVQQELQQAQATGQLAALGAALDAFHQRFPAIGLEAGMRLELENASHWLTVERRRQQWLAELRGASPAGASVRVEAIGGGYRAVVRLSAEQLARQAPAGFVMVEGQLRYEPDRSQDLGQLRLDSGLPAAATEVDCRCELVLPAAASADRSFLLGCRGRVALLTMTRDDAVFATWVEGVDAGKEGALDKALRQALAQAIEPGPSLFATPGAVHRLTLSLRAAPGGRRQRLELTFERGLLARESAEADVQHGIDVFLRPTPGLAVCAIEISATLPE